MSEKGKVYGKNDAQQMGVRDDHRPVPESDRLPNGRRDLTKLPHIILGKTEATDLLPPTKVLGEHDIPEDEKLRARMIGTLIDEHGRIVSVQNPDRPIKID